MTEFWLDNFMDLFSNENFNLKNSDKSEYYIKILNIIALVSILLGFTLITVTKNPIYFGVTVIVLSVTILIKSNITTNFFTNTQGTATATSSKIDTNAFDTGVYLANAAKVNDSQIFVNQASGFSEGDVIVFNDGVNNLETNIVSTVKYTVTDNTPVIILLKNIKNDYPKYTTKILKVSQSSPSIVSSPDPNISIINSNPNNVSSDPMVSSFKNYPKFNLPNQNRNDWNLELSSMVSGEAPGYEYQGQPNGDLKCRPSSLENPMGTINITEYDNAPTMFGTCNVGEDNNDNKMTTNQESTVSQRVDDLLFHRGNSQSRYSPMPVDILPNDQEGFAHFLYRNPTNLVNPKYASIFVNDPEKYKLISKLARATGTENGGGGGGGGRP